MLKSLFIIIIVSFFFPLCLFSQTGKGVIKGRIVDTNGKPAVNVNLELKNIRKFSTTDNAGFFILRNLPALHDTLIISAIGSKPLIRVVNLAKSQTIDIGVVKLEFKIVQLQSVEINGRLTNSYKSDYSFFGNKTQTSQIDIPQSISTVTKEILKDKMEFTLKDAVADVAGLNQYSGYDEYTIRGFHADNAHDINGLRSYNSLYTSNMLVNIERVEVIKGPTATLYGNCDPGGTINMVTKKPLDKNEAEIDLYTGSWNHFKIQGDITGPLNSSKTLLYRFNAGFDSTKSFRNQFFSKSYQLAPSLSFILNDKFKVNIDFSLSHVNSIVDRGQPGFLNNTSLNATPISLSLTQPGDYLHETDISSIITASYKITKNLTFSTGYLNYNTNQRVAEHGLNDYITTDSVSLYYNTWNYHTVTNTITNYFTYNFSAGKINNQMLLGYDYINTQVSLNQQYYELPDQFGAGSGIVGTFSLSNPQYLPQQVKSYQLSASNNDNANIDFRVYKTQGVYFQDQLSFNKWKMLFSLREEFYSGADSGTKVNAFLPRIGIVYAVKPNLNAYVTYNKGFDPYEGSSSVQVFNAPFKPVTSELLETGLKGNFFLNRLTASVSLYELTLQNVAVNANDISNPNLFVQQGEDRSKGIEAEAAGYILPNLSVSLSYAYCDAKVIKSQVPSQVGTRVENAPLNSSSSWIKYTFDKGFIKGFGFAAGTSQESKRNTLDPNITLPGYLILKGEMHYTYKHFIAAIIVNNITNETYWTGAYNNVNKWPGQPRNYLINIGYKF